MRPGYLLQSALTGMGRAAALTATSTTTLAVGLWLMGSLVMALIGTHHAAKTWATGGHITCGIAGDVDVSAHEALRAQVSALPGVRRAELLSAEQSLQALNAAGERGRQLAIGIEADMLPASLRIEPAQSVAEQGAMNALATRIGQVPGVYDVDFGAVPLAHLQQIVAGVSIATVTFAVALAAALTFMVTNTIRLMIYSRQDEVRILQLVGATDAFVRGPFLMEGLLWGLCAGLLASAFSYATERAVQTPLAALSMLLELPDVPRLFAGTLMLAQLAAGASIGLVGSAFAVRSFVREGAGASA